MADRTVTVGPGQTYASLNAALAAEMAANPNLTTDNGSGGAGILTFECHNFEDTTVAVTGAGWTTNSSYYLNIIGRAADKTASNTGIWSTERYRLTGTATNGLVFTNDAAYTRLVDLQFKSTVVNPINGCTVWFSTGGGWRAERCIFVGVISGTNTGGIAAVYASANLNGTVINCLAYDYVNGTGSHSGFNVEGSTSNLYNCTTVNCRTGFQRSTGTVNWINCGASGSFLAFSSGGTATTCSSSTPTFVNAAAKDYHLAITDVTWRQGATDSSATFTTDIDGATRPTGASTWDIGFDQSSPSSASVSPSASISPSKSPSASPSLSPSASPSYSPSASPDRTVTVGPDKDYPDLASALAAEVARYGDLVSNQMLLTFECYSMEDDLTGLGVPITVSGWTTSSSYYVRIKGADSDKTASNTGKWSTDRYRIKGDENQDVLVVSSAYTRVEDIQLEQVVNGLTAAGRNAVTANSAPCTVSRCIAKASVSGSNTQEYHGFHHGNSGGTLTLENCIAYDFYAAGETKGYGFVNGFSSTTLNAYNCTAYNTYRGFRASAGTANWYNCGAAVFSGAGFSAGTQTTCSSSTPTFVDATGRDLHLAEGDTTWRGQGTDYTGTVVGDIDGDDRPVGSPWDIGADQYLVPSTASPSASPSKSPSRSPSVSESASVSPSPSPSVAPETSVKWGDNTVEAGVELVTWKRWFISAGVPIIVEGDADWGSAEVAVGVPIYGPVTDTGSTDMKIFSVTMG